MVNNTNTKVKGELNMLDTNDPTSLTTQDRADENGERLPWEILSVIPGATCIHVEGRNHYDEGKRFCWGLGPITFENLEFCRRRYDFSGARFEGNTRELLLRVWPDVLDGVTDLIEEAGP